MKLYILFETAFKSIRKNARRSLLTMVGLIIGTAAVITIISVGRGYEKYQMKRLLPGSDGKTIQTTISFNPNYNNFESTNLSYFNSSDLSLIKEIKGVINVEYKHDEPEKIYRTKIVSSKDYKQSTGMQLLNKAGRTVMLGRNLDEADIVNQNKIVVISKELAQEILKESDELSELIGQTLQIENEDFKIVGIYNGKPSDTFKFQIPISTYEYYFGTASFKEIVVTISNDYSSKVKGKEIVDLLKKQGSVRNLGEYANASSAAMVDSLSSLFQSLTLLISFVGGVSLFISGVGVMNMIYTSVSERTKEIGIRRSLGATENAIQMQFLLEGLTITIIGGFIGYIVGLIIAKVISKIMNFNFIPDLYTAGVAIIISVSVGVIFSYLPSKSATEKDIVELVK